MSPTYQDLDVIDATCFAEYGVDLVRVDNCFASKPNSLSYSESVMQRWRTLLPQNISLYNSRYGCMATPTCRKGNIYNCGLGKYKPYAPFPTYCNEICDTYRISRDIEPNWGHIVDQVKARIGKRAYSKPGSWADLDTLMIDNSLIPFVMQRSQFSLWCVLSSNLLISSNMNTIQQVQIDMLGNPIAISVNQQYFGDSGDFVLNEGWIWVFRKGLDQSNAIVVVNFSAFTQYAWTVPNLESLIQNKTVKLNYCQAYDIWANSTMTLVKEQSFLIQPTDCMFLIISSCA